MIQKINDNKETDLLYSAAIKYQELFTKGYHIVLGKKNKEYHIQLRFPYDSFFHLVGLQHLTDLKYPSTNKERIYKEIIKGKINYETIKKSQYFDEYHIEERIQYIQYLEEILDSTNFVFLINLKEYIKYTKIKANFLFKHDFVSKEPTILYLFLIKENSPKICNEYKGCSFFKKHDKDFSRGTSRTTILFIEKYRNADKPNQEEEILFINPTYNKKEP